MVKHIEKIKNRIANPGLPLIERKVLEHELSKTSKLLDYSEQFVPMPKPFLSIEIKGPEF